MRLPSHLEHYTTGAFAPYVRERRLVGLVGSMIEVAQPAGDFSDPPVSDLVIARVVSNSISQRSNLGGGRFCERSPAGSLFVVAPETSTDILVYNDHVIRCFAFPAAILRPVLEEVRPGRDPFDFGRLHAGPFQNPFILGLLDRLWQEAERGDAATRLFADGAMLALAAELMREAERPFRPVRGGLAPWQLKRVTEYLEAHLAEDVALAELASVARLSPSHFRAAFRVATNLSPSAYLVQRRIERAKTLLRPDGPSLAEIALACGFSDQSHFTRRFRQAAGITPKMYRDQLT